MPFARLGGAVFVALGGLLLVVLLLGRPVPALSGVAVVALGALVYEGLKTKKYLSPFTAMGLGLFKTFPPRNRE